MASLLSPMYCWVLCIRAITWPIKTRHCAKTMVATVPATFPVQTSLLAYPTKPTVNSIRGVYSLALIYWTKGKYNILVKYGSRTLDSYTFLIGSQGTGCLLISLIRQIWTTNASATKWAEKNRFFVFLFSFCFLFVFFFLICTKTTNKGRKRTVGKYLGSPCTQHYTGL